MFCFSVTPSLSLANLPEDQTPVLDYEQAIQRLDRFVTLIRELQSHIDRSQFDPDALLSKLSYEAELIIEFVQEDIYFEQYPGLLRSVKGTLMSRAGNALDQSVLLASLLKDAGYDARIKRGQLDDGQAIRLLQQMAKPKKRGLVSGDTINYRNTLRRLALLVNIPDAQIEQFVDSALRATDVKSSKAYADAQEDKAFIVQHLTNADIDFARTDITEVLVQEAKDYFWVEYRFGPSNPWVPTHPALGENLDLFSHIEPIDVFTSEVPEALHHRFRFQVFIEQKTGDKLKSTALTSPWERPVANLLGLSLSFGNIPDGLTEIADLDQPGKVIDETRFLIPVFSVAQNQEPLPDFFDMNGLVIDKEAITMGGAATGVFQTVGDKMESALEGTAKMDSDGSGEDDEFRALSAQWIEYTLIAPGGNEKKIKRYVIDRIGAANRAAGIVKLANYVNHEEAIWKLSVSNRFMLSLGGYPEAYIFDRYLERLITSRPILELVLHDTFFPDNPTEISTGHVEAVKNTIELWLADSIERGAQTEPGLVDYRHEPGLIIVSSELSYDEQGSTERLVVDIASDSRRILQIDNNKITYAPQNAIFSGTWATRAEEINVLGPASEQVSQWNTRKAFAQAEANQIPIKILKPGNTSSAKLIKGISVEARNAIAQDLESGFAVIVPEWVEGDSSQVGWWRVNPKTGETLGMINEGLGSEIVKYKVVLALVSLKVMILMAVPGLIDCLKGNKCSDTGCWTGAGVGVLIGYAIGFAVGLITVALATPGAVTGIVVSVDAAAGVAGAASIGIARGMDMANAASVLPSVPSCIE